ncbi:hypothetical protein [Arthrobacter sp. yr096]|uniref:hypothetical protein n=1 Tax=Arthrobacter sp. yr096 TaxID=1761750 RepID=UPI001C42FB4F|nr:hypothetical protein [Arthrobacter sp. yr096]
MNDCIFCYRKFLSSVGVDTNNELISEYLGRFLEQMGRARQNLIVVCEGGKRHRSHTEQKSRNYCAGRSQRSGTEILWHISGHPTDMATTPESVGRRQLEITN